MQGLAKFLFCQPCFSLSSRLLPAPLVLQKCYFTFLPEVF